jgi:hypothetical protein
MHQVILLVHLAGMGLALGGAAVKLSILVGCRLDPSLTAAYVRVAKPITRLIVVGMLLLTASGILWLVLGRPFTPELYVKIALAGVVWVLGPVIDNVVEPTFVRLAPAGGAAVTPEFARVQRRHLALELIATALLGAITVLGVLV